VRSHRVTREPGWPGRIREPGGALRVRARERWRCTGRPALPTRRGTRGAHCLEARLRGNAGREIRIPGKRAGTPEQDRRQPELGHVDGERRARAIKDDRRGSRHGAVGPDKGRRLRDLASGAPPGLAFAHRHSARIQLRCGARRLVKVRPHRQSSGRLEEGAVEVGGGKAERLLLLERKPARRICRAAAMLPRGDGRPPGAIECDEERADRRSQLRHTAGAARRAPGWRRRQRCVSQPRRQRRRVRHPASVRAVRPERSWQQDSPGATRT